MNRIASRPLASQMGRLLLLCAAVAACRGATGATSQTLGAEGRAEELFGALAVRFGAVRRDSALEASRAKLIRYALSPSRLYADTLLWTDRGEEERTVVIAGSLVDGEYLLAARSGALAPQRTGDMRGTMTLRRLGPSVYEWDTRTEMAAGALRAGDLIAAAAALGVGVQARSEDEIRQMYRTALARASASFGRLLDLDTLRTTPCADGATSVHAVLTFHPERIGDEYPGFAAYLTRYVGNARYRFALADREGGRWGMASVSQGVLALDLRLRDDGLVPLDSPARAFPDSLQLRADLSMRGPLFTIGASDLVADVRVLRDGDQRGISLRFREEPKWHFPLAVRHFIGGSLRRPFEGEGSEIRILSIQRPGASTLLATEVHTVVQESLIVRWLGRYGSSMLSAITPDIEREADRFLSELFAAIEGDLRQMREVTEE